MRNAIATPVTHKRLTTSDMGKEQIGSRFGEVTTNPRIERES
jgi:hypothetical protein